MPGLTGALKPQSHRIVRFLDRTIGCDLANVRPIDNVCYYLQKRSHTAIGLLAGGRSSYDWSYAWSRDQHRLEKIDGKNRRSIVRNRTTSGSHLRPIVDQSWHPTIDRSYDQLWVVVAPLEAGPASVRRFLAALVRQP